MNARQSLAKPLSRPNYSASLIRHQISATTSKQPVNGQLSRFKTTAASNQNTVASQEEKQNLSWAEYLSIRGKKRRWELATTIPITTAATMGGVSYFSVHTPQFMGLDPLVLTVLSTAGVAGLGYLIGPVIGSQMWRLTHRRTLSLIEDKDREFHHHIKQNRVDPSLQSTSNPVPDFYGEKIGSIKQYRQWLRDQARYRRKALWAIEREKQN